MITMFSLGAQISSFQHKQLPQAVTKAVIKPLRTNGSLSPHISRNSFNSEEKIWNDEDAQ